LTTGFFIILNFPLFKLKIIIFEVDFALFDHFRVNLLSLITSWSILAVFEGFWKM